MECLIVALLIGLVLVGYMPDLALRAVKELAHPISDGGAFASGCIAGSIAFPPVVYLFDKYVALYSMSFDCILLMASVVIGAVSGAVAGVIWSLFKDRQMRTGVKLGAAGGAIAAPISIPVWIVVAMFLFGG